MSAIGRVPDAIDFSATEHRRGCNCMAQAGDRLPSARPIHKTSDISRTSSRRL